MSEKPILFNTEMVRAILDGRKSCTRRVVKQNQFIGLPDKGKNRNSEEYVGTKSGMFKPHCDMTDAELIMASYKAPYQIGDILYVRETWFKGVNRYLYREDYSDTEKFYRNGKEIEMKWRPSIHMPKAAARIWLKVTDVRVERLQDITTAGAMLEGVYPSSCRECNAPFGCDTCPDEGYNEIDSFIEIWNSTIKKSDLDRYGWDANPWVWAIEFERCEKPGKENSYER